MPSIRLQCTAYTSNLGSLYIKLVSLFCYTLDLKTKTFHLEAHMLNYEEAHKIKKAAFQNMCFISFGGLINPITFILLVS